MSARRDGKESGAYSVEHESTLDAVEVEPELKVEVYIEYMRERMPGTWTRRDSQGMNRPQ